jgi:hypothetical protein
MIKEIEYDTSSEPTTPINIAELHQAEQEILDKLPGVLELSSQLTTRISKYIKGASIQIDFGAQA